MLFIISLVVGRDECKRVVTVNNDLYDSQYCILKNTLQCSSFHYVLAHLQSGDYVNVTSNSVSLITIIELHNVNNITIRGQGKTIVMCNNTGVLSCNNCSDVLIEGITWDQCGDPQTFSKNFYGGINFHTISNLTVQNCTFQHSKFKHGLYLLFLVLFIVHIPNSCFTHNANSDNIILKFTCGLAIRTGFIHCVTKYYVASGGMLINEAINGAVIKIRIKHCIIHYNGHFGKVIGIKDMK